MTSFSATTAEQDPHYIQARPSLIAKMRKADLLVCSGADLEIGWLPILLRKSGNSKVQPGQKGYFMSSKMVKLLDKPIILDRSMGDVHAAGNPHIQLDPRRVAIVAKKLSKRLQKIDPAHSKEYQSKLVDFKTRWKKATKKWQKQSNDIRGKSIIVQHNSWVYLQQWLKLNKVAELEPKPGVPPSSRHLSSLLKQMQNTPADIIIYSTYQDPKAAHWLSSKTGIHAIALPSTVNNNETLFQWMDRLIQLLKDNMQ
ncbi:metal ABC transporter substrate-binding protein [sulfur-oxidizing endosymbiont of Gigantopelta aegis]|uniref:metal ABC transporter substrate-binding protein n=1 Tax=sulfur-oxidizing endosymbiont of Gigantopelta aegis TaxID=2794934 RepID=UPI001FE9CAF2|nr:zinc ABC transporter substrate-binding protein [sulfur-oxidizing endosymbiont of Gigantopelta aegis]